MSVSLRRSGHYGLQVAGRAKLSVMLTVLRGDTVPFAPTPTPNFANAGVAGAKSIPPTKIFWISWVVFRAPLASCTNLHRAAA